MPPAQRLLVTYLSNTDPNTLREATGLSISVTDPFPEIDHYHAHVSNRLQILCQVGHSFRIFGVKECSDSVEPLINDFKV